MTGNRQLTDASDAATLIARLERVPFSRWHIRPRLIVGSATFFDAFDALSLAFVLPVIGPLWQLSPANIGWLIAIGYLGQFVGALAFGVLAEAFGRIRSMAAAVAIMSVMSLACVLADSFEMLLVLRLIQGIGVGGEMPVAAVYINELSKARGRGRFFLFYEMIFPIGLMMTGQIGAVVVPQFGWQVMFLIGGLPGLIITLLVLRLPESPRWLIARGRLGEAAAIVSTIEAHASVTSAAGDVEVAADAASAPTVASPSRTSGSRWRELLDDAYRRRTLVVWTLWSCAYFITNGLNNWMPTLYHRVYQLDLQSALRAGTLTNVVQVIVLVFCAFLIDRVGRRRWIATCFTVGVALLALIGVWGGHTVAAVIAAVTLSYGIIGSANAVLYLYTPEIYPTRIRAIGTATATCWLRLASAAAPLLVGYVVAERGIASVFAMFALVGVVGAVTATQMLETQNKRLEETAR